MHPKAHHHAHATKPAAPDRYTVARRRMINDSLLPEGMRDPRVLEAMMAVPRHLFVSPGMQDQAYLDRPLPIGDGQTISQPLIVARMTELLQVGPQHRVLEIGTGSGYQTAILAHLAKHVYTIERLADLSVGARKVLYRLHYHHITFRIGDGTLGFPEHAPFDRIIVTAGGPRVPEALREQLADGGRMVIPIGDEEAQQLLLIERQGDQYTQQHLESCRFVKLIGAGGWDNGYRR